MIGRSPREKVAKGAVSMFVHFRNFNHSTRCLPSMGKNRLNMGFPRFNAVVTVCLNILPLVTPYDISVHSLNCILDSAVVRSSFMFRF